MSIEKKEYVAPKYEMVKFDSQIMTGYGTGCWGVVGVLYDATTGYDDGCHSTYEHGGNIMPFGNEYYD